MRRFEKLAGMLLVLILACNVSITAQRGLRGTMDSTCINRMRMNYDTIHLHGRSEMMNPDRMKGMWHGSGNAGMGKEGRLPYHRPMDGTRRNTANDALADVHWGKGGFGRRTFDPGDYLLESIPNVTEKQKSDISILKQKQQEEMKKLRDDMSAKMQALRDSYQKSMMTIFTGDQKKFIESKLPDATDMPAKTK
jgi:hypothetical protein